MDAETRYDAMTVLWDVTWQAAARHYRNTDGGTKLVPHRYQNWATPPQYNTMAYERQMGRVVYLAQMMLKKRDKGVNWSIVAFKSRIAGIERLLEIQDLGLGTPRSEQAVAVLFPNRVAQTLRRLHDAGENATDDEICEHLIRHHRSINSLEKAHRELDNYRQLKQLSRGGGYIDNIATPNDEVTEPEDEVYLYTRGETWTRKQKRFTYLVT